MDSMPEVTAEISAKSKPSPSSRDSSFAAFIVGCLISSGAIPYAVVAAEPMTFVWATEPVARCLRLQPDYDPHGDWVETPL